MKPWPNCAVSTRGAVREALRLSIFHKEWDAYWQSLKTAWFFQDDGLHPDAWGHIPVM